MQPLHQVLLRTSRLTLRPLADSDAVDLFALHSDQDVARYLSRPAWESIDSAYELIARDQEALAAGKYLHLGIHRTQAPGLIGECSLHSLNEPSRRAEVGYAIAPPAWRQGFAVEAVAALIEFAFVDLEFNRLEADIDPRNRASAKVLQRLGFEQEGYLRERWIVRGEVSDSALYGLLRSTWKGRRAAAGEA